MKSFILTIALMFVTLIFSAQTSNRPFSFQGYAIDADGKALATTSITVRFTVYDNGGSGATYTEEDIKTTDVYGVFSAYVGDGTPNEFKKLNFTAKNAYFKMKVEVKKTTAGTFITIHDDFMAEVPYARYAENGVPVGTIVAFAGPKNKIPAGWLPCDGTSYDGSSPDYKQLYDVIGTAWGSTGGSQFNVPDLRGMFLRGVDETADVDPDKNTRTAKIGGNSGNLVGSYQLDKFKQHNHTGTTSTDGAHTHDFRSYNANFNHTGSATEGSTKDDEDGTFDANNMVLSAGDHSHTIPNDGGSETRPVNAYVYYIIKY
jgi:microcystin-dependent protein